MWNWRGTNEKGGKTVLPDWESIALNDRRVFLVFDSDAMEKQGVHAALERLERFLKSRGALVKIVYLPGDGDAKKVGVDDYLAAGGTIKDLVGLAEDTLRPLPGAGEGAPEPTARLLEYVMNLIRRHVHLPGEHEMVALALYVLHTYALAEAHVTPYMLVTSPAKRSGKTRLLETLELVVREPLRAASVTPAAMYQADRPVASDADDRRDRLDLQRLQGERADGGAARRAERRQRPRVVRGPRHAGR